MYCLKHAAELECYGQGGPAKPKCQQPECGGGYAIGAYELLGEVNASINLVAGEDYESDEDEEWWVNMVRIEGRGENLQEFEDPGLEESEEEADNYFPNICMRKDDWGLEDKLDFFWDVSPPPQKRTKARRTDGGPPGPRDWVPKRKTRRRTSTSSVCS